jgi:Domain of unknown function (DUF5658)
VSDWGPGALTWWMAGWTAADVLLVVAMSAVAARWMGARIAARPVTVHRGHIAVAVAVAGLITAALAALSGLIAGGAASAQAAVSFVTADAVPMLAAGMLALAGRGGGWQAAMLFTALGLDAVAGLLGDGDPWTGPQRLGGPQGGASGQLESPPRVLFVLAITVAICVVLLSVAPLARALQVLQCHSGVGVILGLFANTIDAVATQAGLGTGVLVEANPVVRLVGLAGKWVAVTILLLVLYRIRPQAVWIATTAYVLVVGYHVVGALLLA